MPKYIGVAHGQLAWLAWKAGYLTVSEREGEVALELRLGRLPAAVSYAGPVLESPPQRLPGAFRSVLEGAVRAVRSRDD